MIGTKQVVNTCVMQEERGNTMVNHRQAFCSVDQRMYIARGNVVLVSVSIQLDHSALIYKRALRPISLCFLSPWNPGYIVINKFSSFLTTNTMCFSRHFWNVLGLLPNSVLLDFSCRTQTYTHERTGL